MTDDPNNQVWHPSFDGDRLRLTLAIGEYDHVRDLCTGRVPAEGLTVTALHLPTEEIFHRFLRYREWEVSEISFAKYAAMRSQGDNSLMVIPVFPSRVFRHSSIYVRRDGPVQAPSDLAGRRIGVPEWAQTAAVYTRGLLADSYGIDLRGISWTQAGVNQPGRMEKVRLSLPDGIQVQPRPDASLDQLLRAGELDAVLSAHAPASFDAGILGIIRLFPNAAAVEQAYYQTTGIFPIMHVVVLRAAVLDRFPWVAMNLFDAFDAAKARSQARLGEYTASRVPLPWVQPAVAAEGAVRGRPFPVRCGAEPGHARRLPGLGARAGRHDAPAGARGAVRSGDSQPHPDLTRPRTAPDRHASTGPRVSGLPGRCHSAPGGKCRPARMRPSAILGPHAKPRIGMIGFVAYRRHVCHPGP